MTAEPRGRDLFIVDNSVSGWTALRYLEDGRVSDILVRSVKILLVLMPKAPVFECHIA